MDSVFRVLEPVVGKINERAKAPVSLSSRLGLRQPRSEWFRVYRVRTLHLPLTRIPEINVILQDFFLPSESYDLVFLKARIAILCTKGFEIMDLSELVTTLCPVYCWMAEVLSAVLRASQFRNATIHVMRSSLSGASHAVLWACSAPAKTSSFFAMMVRMTLATLFIYHLTLFLRIRVVCEPPRRP